MKIDLAESVLPYIVVLGITQDAGYPHIGCTRRCCTSAWEDSTLRRMPVSLALVDPGHRTWWLIEATPGIREQLHLFALLTHGEYSFLPEAVFITHAHFGHYTGLLQLGREALNAHGVQVNVLPRMKDFLERNAPWQQLVTLNNIVLAPIKAETTITLSEKITLDVFTVPHRDEYSETAGFRINTSAKKYLFIPDIDSWFGWQRNVVEEVREVDIAFLDATFYSEDELGGRPRAGIPHPLVSETIQLFEHLVELQHRIHFIHFNHSNPLLFDGDLRSKMVANGYQLSEEGHIY
jgi:pyrroloquinoline quinone biosynthesis protein B